MDDELSEIFTPEAIARLGRTASPGVSQRLEVLSACGPTPSCPGAAIRMRCLRARRAAWEWYLTAARGAGLLDDPHGGDLRARLTGRDEAGFRSAIGECLACWFFPARLRLPVLPRPTGRGGSVLELRVPLAGGDLHVEVKAPYRAPPTGRIWYGDDASAIASCLERAEKQFERGVRNVLFLVPQLRIAVSDMSYQLVRPLMGEFRFVTPIDLSKGEAVGPTRPEFFAEGKLLKPRRGGNPCFTRVSAVVTVEEAIKELPREGSVVTHRVLVIHNPNAATPISEEIWGDYPQLVARGERMGWTDGRRIL